MVKTYTSGPWTVAYTPEDGGRLTRLAYRGYDLLTAAPVDFRPPAADYGIYETRPVYGYDDCFPSVRPSPYPGSEKQVPDHGELWQLEWEVLASENQLQFQVKSELIPVRFTRRMHFSDHTLRWQFQVENLNENPLPFLHVIHPMMRLEEIQDIGFPAFNRVYDEIQEQDLPLDSPDAVTKFLLNRDRGTANMIYLKDIHGQAIQWGYHNGLRIRMQYDDALFRSVGIWWNRAGYPDEDGLRRTECAFEPIPGNSDHLQTSAADKSCFMIAPQEEMTWEVTWELREE